MKKIIIISAVILLAMVTGLIMINSEPEEKDETVKVGVILNGYKDDKSWSQSHYEGLEKTHSSWDLKLHIKSLLQLIILPGKSISLPSQAVR